MTLHAEIMLSEARWAADTMAEFLHRFLHAANAHVELEPFIVEGETLLRSVEND